MTTTVHLNMPLTMTIVLNLTEEARALDALERPEGGKQVQVATQGTQKHLQ